MTGVPLLGSSPGTARGVDFLAPGLLPSGDAPTGAGMSPLEPSRAEVVLAARLYPHVCAESAIDRAEHALGVARLVLSVTENGGNE